MAAAVSRLGAGRYFCDGGLLRSVNNPQSSFFSISFLVSQTNLFIDPVICLGKTQISACSSEEVEASHVEDPRAGALAQGVGRKVCCREEWQNQSSTSEFLCDVD